MILAIKIFYVSIVNIMLWSIVMMTDIAFIYEYGQLINLIFLIYQLWQLVLHTVI